METRGEIQQTVRQEAIRTYMDQITTKLINLQPSQIYELNKNIGKEGVRVGEGPGSKGSKDRTRLD